MRIAVLGGGRVGFAPFLAEPPAGRASLVVAGGDAEAKGTTAQLGRDAGFDPIDAGGADAVPLLEAFARLAIGIAYRLGRGRFRRFEVS